MTMHDPFEEARKPCKDCGDFLPDEALSDGQCFLCWVEEAEEKDYKQFLSDILDNLIDDITEGRA